jgi:hypothetical protein
MAVYSDREKTRIATSNLERDLKRRNAPPKGQGWIWETAEFLDSISLRSLSVNAHRAYIRIKSEHVAHAGQENGRLIVTHDDFRNAGMNGDLVADAIDELIFKGLIRVARGRSGNGTPHPNLYCLTSYPTHDSVPATNDWKGVTEQKADRWHEIRKQLATSRAAKTSSKRKTPLSDPRVPRSGNTESEVDLKRGLA